MIAKFKLQTLLESLGLKPLAVEKCAREVLGYNLGENTIYRLLAKDPKVINLQTMEAIIAAIRHLTGRRLSLADIVDFEEESEIPQKGTVRRADKAS